jgi:hypothetical protein
MPVTAKLSLKLYEKLGEDVVNELVEWLNQVDATYRNDLRELNELNFARFDAKLDQRVDGLRAEMEARFARTDAKLDQRVAELHALIEQRAAELRADLRSEFHRELGVAKAELIRWAFVFWVPTALGVIGLYFKP